MENIESRVRRIKIACLINSITGKDTLPVYRYQHASDNDSINVEAYTILQLEVKRMLQLVFPLSNLHRLRGMVFRYWGELSKRQKETLTITFGFGRIFQLILENDNDIDVYLQNQTIRLDYTPPMHLEYYQWRTFFLIEGEIHRNSECVIASCSCFKNDIDVISRQRVINTTSLGICEWCITSKLSNMPGCKIDSILTDTRFVVCTSCNEYCEIAISATISQFKLSKK